MKQSFSWDVLELTVGKSKHQLRTVLRDIRGEARAGTFTGLLGPSGSGKTSLLECISLRNRTFTGSVHVDGAIPSSEFYTSAALVYQKELLFSYMTPREHLNFHATARLSRHAHAGTIAARVEEALKAANLELCQDTVIGGMDPLFMAKGLSGGERKRLAVATELLRCPAIIFLDEPTSGLDSVMAESVVRTLAQLSGTGRIVMASLHCPSSDVMGHLTHLTVLTYDGRLAYHGPRKDAVAHFEQAGYAYPVDYNPADYMLRIVSRSQYAPAKDEQSRMDMVVQRFKQSPHNTATVLPPTNVRQLASGVQPPQSSSWVLFRLNYSRVMLFLRREWPAIVALGVVSVAIGVLFGALFWQQAEKSWRNTLGLNFSVAVSTVIFGSVAMVLQVPLGHAVLHREYVSGVNSPGPFLAAHYLGSWPYYVAPLLEAAVMYWMTGMPVEASRFLYFCLILTLMSLASLSLGVLVGSLTQHITLCIAALPALVTPMIMFSGLLYERDTVPAWLCWVEDVSIVNYGFSALMIKSAESMEASQARFMMSFLQIAPRDLWLDLMMLAVLNLAFQIGAYVVLKARFLASGSGRGGGEVL